MCRIDTNVVERDQSVEGEACNTRLDRSATCTGRRGRLDYLRLYALVVVQEVQSVVNWMVWFESLVLKGQYK